MLFHMSIAAHDPRRVASVIAEIWGGEAHIFPPVMEGSWVALAGDDRGTILEVYPIDTVLIEGRTVPTRLVSAPGTSAARRRTGRSPPISIRTR